MSEIWTVEEEARRLELRFASLKVSTGMGQAAFARKFGVPGGASMVSQHVKGRRPINLMAAAAYSVGFGCSIAEISPRVANDIEESIRVGHPVQSTPKNDAFPVGVPAGALREMSLEQTVERLGFLLSDDDELTRERALDPLKYLIKTPDDHAQVAAMMAAALRNANKKAA